MIGDADCETYVKSLQILIDDPGTDAILVMNAPQRDRVAVGRDGGDCAGSSRRETSPKPILTSWLGGLRRRDKRAKGVLERGQIPTYDTPENAVRAFMHMVRYRRNQADSRAGAADRCRRVFANAERGAVGD
jgi:acetyltransferase